MPRLGLRSQDAVTTTSDIWNAKCGQHQWDLGGGVVLNISANL